MTALRIAYLTGEYPRATDTFIQREVAALREQGVEVHTFSVRRTSTEHIVGREQEREREQTFYILPPSPLKILRAHLALLLRSPARYLRALELARSTRQPGIRGHLYQLFYFAEAGLLAGELLRRGVRHLHNHFGNSSCSVAMLAAELSGLTFSFTIHGPAIFFEPRRWRIDEKIKRALFVSCISHYCRSQAMVFAPRDCWERMHIVHCGVDSSLYEMASHEGQGRRLLYVGRLAATKGLPILMESVASLRSRYPDLILTVVGDGPDRSELQEQAARLGVTPNLRFLGYRSQTEVRDEMRGADVFVLPSFAEGVPVVLMEALATGVPVVATRVAGVGELVEEGVSGYLVPPGDPIPLAEGIGKLIEDPGLRSRFGAAGRAKVEREFDVRREAARLHSILEAALSGERGGAMDPTRSRDLGSR
jgi:colanic acid/amylovoran biosynthesis glycosyltransferase